MLIGGYTKPFNLDLFSLRKVKENGYANMVYYYT